MEDFVHLHVHTQYSILDGQSKIPHLVDKAIKDGMNGIAWLDDSQVVHIVDCRKVYAEQPGVDVIVAGLEVAHA